MPPPLLPWQEPGPGTPLFVPTRRDAVAGVPQEPHGTRSSPQVTPALLAAAGGAGGPSGAAVAVRLSVRAGAAVAVRVSVRAGEAVALKAVALKAVAVPPAEGRRGRGGRAR